ncbi:ABC transporter ATP-binding protein [Clostridium hydrogeniformans]|uniref:ABC transporter ATP-binding protein n=1 Tax=Clostridium hydrogeniformans TaxID=349933 RepID=UPI000480D5FA|nr:ABC transporter ATP-binding protein [Clostridium hydrogeniformans]
MYVIETNNLSKTYGKHRGIIDVNIAVKKGEIFGFIGPNGAGKSTTIKTLLNFIYPTSGGGTILGKDIVKESMEIKKHIGYVPSEVKYYENVKVLDLINYAASFYPESNKEDIEDIIKELDIEKNKTMGELSLGNKKKVAIAQAIIGKPKVLILDEPTNGLDPIMQNKLFSILLKEKAKGTTIFLSSHNLVEVQNLCDRVCVIKEGRIVDTLNIKESNERLGVKVTLKGEGINEEKILSMCYKVINKEENKYCFIYRNNVDKLIKELSTYTIDNLLIEEESLEDTFLNYYKKEGNK